MKLLELTLKAFGRLQNVHFSFHPKVNVVYGPNEAGKSTLQQAIVALLYGFYDNNRALSRERELHEQYRPWFAPRPPDVPNDSANHSSTGSVKMEVPAPGKAALSPRKGPIKIVMPQPYSMLQSSAEVVVADFDEREENALEISPAAPSPYAAGTSSTNAPRHEYSGSLKYSLEAGHTLLIHRDFGDNDVPTQLLDAITGEDWLLRYRRGRHGRVDFMEKQIGMSRQVFLATACVQQGSLRPLAERDAGAVSDAILRLLDSAGTDNSAEVAIERLEKQLRELGSDRSQKALLPQARLQLEELHETYALRLATQRAVQDDIEKAETLELELDELRHTLLAIEREMLRVQLTQIEARLSRWQENERKCEQITGEITALAPYQNFPIEDKERFFELWHDFAHFDKLRTMLSEEHSAIDLKLDGQLAKSKNLHISEALWTSFAFEDFLKLRNQWETNFNAIINSENAKFDVDEEFKKAGLNEVERAAFVGLDWPQIEQYRALETQVKEVEAEVEAAREDYNKFQADTQRHRRLAALMALVALVALTTGFLNSIFGDSNSALKAWDNTMLTLSLLGMALFIVFNIRWIARSRELGSHLLEVEDQYMEIRPQLQEALTRYRVSSIDELVQRRSQFSELTQAAQTHLQLTQDLAKLEKDLQPWMAALGIPHIAPETLQDAEKRLRESHQLWTEKNVLQQSLAQIAEKQREVEKDLDWLVIELQAILQKAGITEPPGEKALQSFATGCQRREYLESLRLQLNQAETLGEEILAGETPQSLAATVEHLRQELHAMESESLAAAPGSSVAPAMANPGLKLAPEQGAPLNELSLAELQRQREEMQEEIREKEQKLIALRERVATRLQDLPPLAEIEEEIALVEAEVKRLERAREALELARDYIAQAAQRLHRDFAPRLNDFLGKYLGKLSAGRYVSAMIDPSNFSVRLQRADSSAPVELARLSFGTIEQVYLLLRAAVVEFFAENSESIPMLLDDPLVHADSERMLQALHIIDALAESHQIFYFTKDPVVVDYFRGKPEECAIIKLQAV